LLPGAHDFERAGCCGNVAVFLLGIHPFAQRQTLLILLYG
jgi:hypothetical protein